MSDCTTWSVGRNVVREVDRVVPFVHLVGDCCVSARARASCNVHVGIKCQSVSHGILNLKFKT